MTHKTKAKHTKEILPVMFRASRNDRSDVYALFPTLPGTNDPWTCTCYQHVGQHSSADLRGCINSSRPAKLAEYEDLLRELTRIYDDCHLRKIKRTSPAMNTLRFKLLEA